VTYAAPNLTWTGDLVPGAAATITYSVTVDNPDTGGHVLATTAINIGEVYAGMRRGEESKTEAFLSSLDCYPLTSAIARRAGCNQSLVFYHFGSVTNLLLAALDEVSATRHAHYQAAVDWATGLGELVDAAEGVFEEDLDAGHIAVLVEMIAGVSATPGLAPEVAARIVPWRQFAALGAEGVPDGLKVASDGSVWVADAHGGRVVVFDQDGTHWQDMPVPLPMVTSLCFGGDDLRDLYIVTGSRGGPSENCGSIFRTRVDVAGLALPPARVAA